MKQDIEVSDATEILSLSQFAEELRVYKYKAKLLNHQRKKIEKYLNRLKQFHDKLLEQVRKKGIDLESLNDHDGKLIKGLIKRNRHKHKSISICNGLCRLNRIPPRGMNSIDEIESVIEHLEEQLAIVGEDSQLAETDLENAMQQSEMMLQMSNDITKQIQDSAMAVIRDIK